MDCTKCDYHTNLRTNYERHMQSRRHIAPKPDYNCSICGYLAPNRQSYLRHQKIDCLKPNIEYTCGPCEFSTSCKQKHDTHLRTQLHCKIFTNIKVKEIPSPSYLLDNYRKSSVKMGLHYLGYRRSSTYSKYIIFQNKLVSLDDYTTAYNELEATLKNEPAYEMKYKRYAYVNKCLSPDLIYPFSM
jgi:hypothetical protein